MSEANEAIYDCTGGIYAREARPVKREQARQSVDGVKSEFGGGEPANGGQRYLPHCLIFIIKLSYSFYISLCLRNIWDFTSF